MQVYVTSDMGPKESERPAYDQSCGARHGYCGTVSCTNSLDRVIVDCGGKVRSFGF